MLTGIYAHNADAPHRIYDLINETDYFGKVGTIFHGWDSNWYLKIAESGYPKININDLRGKETPLAFYPLYPLVIKLLSVVFGLAGASLLASNLFFLFSGLILYELVRRLSGPDLAYKSAVLLFLFPVNFIFSAIQSESLFLFLLLLVFLFLQKKKYLAAGFAGFFLSLSRPVGFLITIPIIIEAFKSLPRLESFTKKVELAVAVILPSLGLATFVLYLAHLTGSLTAFLVAENAWGKSFSLNPVRFFTLVENNFRGFFIVDVALGLIIILLAVFGLGIFGFSCGLLMGIMVLVYLTTTSKAFHLLSFPRYFVVLFPAYVGLAKLSVISKLFDASANFTFLFLQLILFFFWTRGFPIPM